MQQTSLNVELRNGTGKGISRRLRAKEQLPGIIYGKGMESVAVALGRKDLLKAIAGEGGHNNIITLQGALDGTMVIVTDMERDAIKGYPTHVDLHKISLTERLRVKVPVKVVGNAAGVKAGGLLDVVMHELVAECLPTEIPEHIDVDVTELTIGHAVHVSEIALIAGVKLLDDPKAPVVCVLGKAKEEVPAEGAEA
ncbi:MAG: 50S ribosomal protein L25 [Geobacter sp.]|nr:50S ribosomal protein L25 [Geobacter sp.]